MLLPLPPWRGRWEVEAGVGKWGGGTRIEGKGKEEERGERRERRGEWKVESKARNRKEVDIEKVDS